MRQNLVNQLSTQGNVLDWDPSGFCFEGQTLESKERSRAKTLLSMFSRDAD